MATTNAVYSVLPTSGNQAVLAAGSPISALKNGQIGVFNYHTGLSVDGTALGDAQDIYIALGMSAAGGVTNMDDYRKSAGQVLQVRNLRFFTLKGTTDEIQRIVDVSLNKASCMTDYTLKIVFDSISLYGINGFSQISKSFSYYNNCCTSPTDNTINPSLVLISFRDQINADADKSVTVYI